LVDSEATAYVDRTFLVGVTEQTYRGWFGGELVSGQDAELREPAGWIAG
jgi:hypothetical protein